MPAEERQAEMQRPGTPAEGRTGGRRGQDGGECAGKDIYADVAHVGHSKRHPITCPGPISSIQGTRLAAGAPCRLSPRRSSGTRTKANAVNAADAITSGVRLPPNTCV